MTFEQYWDQLRTRNPGLAKDDTKMTITVASFRRSMRQSYDQGADHKKPTKPKEDDSLSKFSKIFGDLKGYGRK